MKMLIAVWLAWGVVASAEGYRLYYGPEPGVQSTFKDVGNNTTGELTGLPPGVPIYIVCRAYNAAGESGPSNEVVWTEPVLPTPTPTPRPRGHSGKPRQ